MEPCTSEQRAVQSCRFPCRDDRKTAKVMEGVDLRELMKLGSRFAVGWGERGR